MAGRLVGRWDEIRDGVVSIVRDHDSHQSVLSRVSELYGSAVTWHALRIKWGDWERAGLVPGRLSSLLGTSRREQARGYEPEPQPERAPNDRYRQLVDVARRGPLPFEALCDKLDLSPTKARTLLDSAKRDGILIRIENDHVGLIAPEPDERIQDLGVPPTIGKRQQVAVISDTHLGSKYCNRAALKEFIQYAHSIGCREVLHIGDVVDGCYSHGVFELTHSGLEEQTQDLFETLPALKGLTYHGITGNHDDTFADKIGIDPGGYIQNYFESRGRKDLKFYGRRGAFLKLRGATIHLWHPRSGVAYARSYSLQRQIEKYAPGEKPDILLAGHWHVFCYVEERGIHALACPTFQNNGSAFSKSLGGAPAIGGLVLSWELTAHGTLRRFAVERSSYYERERPRHIDDAEAEQG